MRPIDLFSISIVLCALTIVLFVPEITLRQVTHLVHPDAARSSLLLRYPGSLGDAMSDQPSLPAPDGAPMTPAYMTDDGELHEFGPVDTPALRYDYSVSRRVYAF